nr:GNAT family N-acetyltransferase [Clostridiales bacterium]
MVLEEYRNQNIGTLLIRKVEELFQNEDFDNYNLTTYEFQAPKFYEKMGYKLEYIRKNNKNSKLNKYFYSKSKR